jgi:transposase-like protein
MLLEKEAAMTISKEMLDELLKGCERPEDLLGETGLMKELKVKLMERMLGAELTEHLGYEDGEAAPPSQSNRRNGLSKKTLKGEDGTLPLAVPRDRDGSFEPELVKKGQTRIDGMDDKIIGLYAAGLTVRDIRTHLEDLYGLKVSADLISRVTDAVLDEVREWQSRALDPMYPIVMFDALRVKIRDADSRTVKNKAVYVALGVSKDGVREVLGLWIAENEGAKFWLSVMNELKNRGLADILIAVVDGLKGFPEAITAAFPETTVQTCIVHLTRHSLNFCGWKDRKAVAADLRLIYSAATADLAADALDAFEELEGQETIRGMVSPTTGREIPINRSGVAQSMAGGDPVLRLRSGDPKDNLHDKRYREPEPCDPKVDQDARVIPNR